MKTQSDAWYSVILLTFVTLLWTVAGAVWVLADTDQRKPDVLSIGGSVTEIVYALDQQHRLVARDTTSVFPDSVVELPNVGYMRALSPEGVLAVEPGLIISEDGAGPPETIDVLKAAAIPFVTIPDAYSSAGIVAKIEAVGRALDVEDKAHSLAQSVADELAKAEARSSEVVTPKRVMFILSTQGGRILASGTNTAADGIIRLAGGVNAVSEFEGYKPLTDEAIGAAAPDVILMMDRGADATGGHSSADEELFAMPALIPTPAAQNKSIVRMDGLYMLGFGPRTASAVSDLNTALYGG
ncbi:MAG: ABC transporter substrate-binding protein [Litoreibacter sp.]